MMFLEIIFKINHKSKLTLDGYKYDLCANVSEKGL